MIKCMHPKYLSIHDYSYELPADRIARYPLEERDSSRLLIYNNGAMSESRYRQLASFLPPHSLLVFNNTRVVAARLFFQKASGAHIEIFCLEPHPRYATIPTAMASQGSVVWLCLIGGASKWKPGLVLEKKILHDGHNILLQARYLGKEKDCFAIELSWTPEELSFADILHHAGQMPLPPYMHREAEATDADRYQTIYANTEGSVAAPTAGLHFTDHIFNDLQQRHIQSSFVTLHVGAGTFRPVKSHTMEEHDMHAEFIDVPRGAIEALLQHLGKHITLVGTTSLRTVESLYWIGRKLIKDPSLSSEELAISQWEPYNAGMPLPSAQQSLQALLRWMENNKMEHLVTKTQLLIAPGYEMKIADALFTNFHQPQSTLLLLVAAFIGSDWHKVYDYALKEGFRFLSYGDGCLLFRRSPSSATAAR